MQSSKTIIRSLLLLSFVFFGIANSSCTTNDNKKGAYYTGKYENLFTDLLGIDATEVNQKIEKAFNQLFHGNDANERVYYPVEPDMAYMLDVINNDVRSEGISYGMMISVQLDKKEEFDRLWKWADTYMRHKSGQRENYFAWHTTPGGVKLDSNSASDGEIGFVLAR
mgnify:CR=1 FL=1